MPATHRKWFPSCRRLVALALLLITAGHASGQPRLRTELLSFDSLASFTPAPAPDTPGEFTWVSKELTPAIPWDELVASWNVHSNAALSIEVRARFSDRYSRYYHLGNWVTQTNTRPRSSVNGQADADGAVLTDTLVLQRSASGLQVRLHFGTNMPPAEALRFLTFSLLDTRLDVGDPAVVFSSTGFTLTPSAIEVPARTQTQYPEGTQNWCSPTSVSMVLAHYGATLHRPDLIQDLRAVAAGVFDPGWPGTGNWSFNVAYAGSHRGIRAFAARLPDLEFLDAWIKQGVPVVASVSYALLKGKAHAEHGDGHLIVVTGIDAQGQVLINDPGVRLERVQRTIPLQDFLRAWAHSKNTVYIIFPEAQFDLDGLRPRKRPTASSTAAPTAKP